MRKGTQEHSKEFSGQVFSERSQQCNWRSVTGRAYKYLQLIMEESTKDKVPNHEDHLVLKYFENVFKDIQWLPPKRDINFSINLMPRKTPVSQTPYRISTPMLKELQIQLEEIMKKGYICPSVSPWGAPTLFVKKKDETLRLCIDFR